jgi:hypothetical protein
MHHSTVVQNNSRKQHISKRNDKITAVQEPFIFSRLELKKDGHLNLLLPFL